MAEAVTAHEGHRSAWYAPIVGPLLCPASRLDELAAHLVMPMGVRVVVDTGTAGIGPAVDAVASDARMVLRGVEVTLRGAPLADAARRTVAALDAALGGPDDDEPAYVEVPREAGWRDALDVVADSGYRAKLRTGGTTPEAVPGDDEVAAFVLSCLDLGIPFKFTAGLHHAVRELTTDGTEQHGFLNVLLAVAAALDDADPAGVARVLAERDRTTVAGRIRELGDRRAAAVRRWFLSYGSCDVDEPLADLVALELVKE